MVLHTFTQISLVILVVFIVSVVMKLLKQPLIIGYIISGVLLGPFFFGMLTDVETLNVFSELGIAFLLFIVGLHLSPKVVKEVGKISLITGLGQILFTIIIGYFLSLLLGFAPLTALYLAVGVSFSSTIIIMKLLTDKGDLYSLYGKISIGFLLVQDLVAIILLMVISSISGTGNALTSLGFTFLKGLVAIFILAPLSMFIFPRLQSFFGRSQELLFIFALAWGLGLAALFFYIGLSLEVGALIAGVLLSISPYSLEVSSKLKSLRDFFLISFFLLLGAQVSIGDLSQIIFPAVVLSLLILIGNPIIVMALMGLSGYTKRTNFLAGLTVAQISEFSLIVVALGVKVGHLPPQTLSLMTLIGLITIAGSTYMIIFSGKMYEKLASALSIFERKKTREKNIKDIKTDAILFGYNRIGFSILNSLKRIRKNFVVVDYNPDVISNLKKLRVPSIYGDSDDEAFVKELPLDKLEIAVSTIPDFDTNALIVESIRAVNPKAIIIVRAHTIDNAMELYKKGASYVLTPHFLGGEYVSEMISEIKTDKGAYAVEKEKHIKMLQKRFEKGQEHPEVEKNVN